MGLVALHMGTRSACCENFSEAGALLSHGAT